MYIHIFNAHTLSYNCIYQNNKITIVNNDKYFFAPILSK